MAQDVVWVNGGSVANLLAVWRVHGLDAILRRVWEAGVVLAGVSAGSICWYEGGTTDSFGPELRAVTDGLGFLPYAGGVHYDSEAGRRPLVHELVAAGALPDDPLHRRRGRHRLPRHRDGRGRQRGGRQGRVRRHAAGGLGAGGAAGRPPPGLIRPGGDRAEHGDGPVHPRWTGPSPDALRHPGCGSPPVGAAFGSRRPALSRRLTRRPAAGSAPRVARWQLSTVTIRSTCSSLTGAVPDCLPSSSRTSCGWIDIVALPRWVVNGRWAGRRRHPCPQQSRQPLIGLVPPARSDPTPSRRLSSSTPRTTSWTRSASSGYVATSRAIMSSTCCIGVPSSSAQRPWVPGRSPGLLVQGRAVAVGRAGSGGSTAQTTLPPSPVGRTPHASDTAATSSIPRPATCEASGRRGSGGRPLASRTAMRSRGPHRATDTVRSVPACSIGVRDQLADHERGGAHRGGAPPVEAGAGDQVAGRTGGPATGGSGACTAADRGRLANPASTRRRRRRSRGTRCRVAGPGPAAGRVPGTRCPGGCPASAAPRTRRTRAGPGLRRQGAR